MRLAEELGVCPRIILNALTSFTEKIHENLPEFRIQFEEEHGSNPVLDRIDQAILKQIRRSRQLMME